MKLKELTPHTSCVVGACPAVFAASDGTIVLIGKKLPAGELANRVGPDEVVVSIDQELLIDALKNHFAQ